MSLVSSSLVTSMADLSTGCLKTKMFSARDKTSCQVSARAARQVLDICHYEVDTYHCGIFKIPTDVNLACFGVNNRPNDSSWCSQSPLFAMWQARVPRVLTLLLWYYAGGWLQCTKPELPVMAVMYVPYQIRRQARTGVMGFVHFFDPSNSMRNSYLQNINEATMEKFRKGSNRPTS